MRRDRGDADRLRSEMKRPAADHSPQRREHLPDGGVPLPARRYVPPAVQPASFAAFDPPASEPRGGNAGDHVLRRVDGTPILNARGRGSRARHTQRHAPAESEYSGYSDLAAHSSSSPIVTAYSDIILDMPQPSYRAGDVAARREDGTVSRSVPQSTHGMGVSHDSQPAHGVIRESSAYHYQATPVFQPAMKPAQVKIAERHLVLPPRDEPEPLPAGVCPRCRGAGYLRLDVPIGHPSFGKATPCACKEQELEQRRRDELWRLSSLDAFKDMTFAHFNPKVAGTREAWEVAQRYAENPGGWLVLSGPCGSGKTHLAAAIANTQFEQGTLVLFTVVPHLLDHLRAAFAPTSETTYDALFEKVCQAGLLVLDDLGAEHSTPWAQEKLFQIINHRYMYRYPTVITTNLDLINDLDDRVRSRLTDIGLVRHVRLDTADYRPHNVSRRTSRAQRI